MIYIILGYVNSDTHLKKKNRQIWNLYKKNLPFDSGYYFFHMECANLNTIKLYLTLFLIKQIRVSIILRIDLSKFV